MSLVVGWLMEDFVAIASDGKAIAKDERGERKFGRRGGSPVSFFHTEHHHRRRWG